VQEQCAIAVPEEAWQRFLKAHFPLKDEQRHKRHPQFQRRHDLDRLWRTDERVAPWRGTAYGVIAAVNTYEHHIAEGKPDRSRPERNAHRAVNGSFDALDERTSKTLLRILQAAH